MNYEIFTSKIGIVCIFVFCCFICYAIYKYRKHRVWLNEPWNPKMENAYDYNALVYILVVDQRKFIWKQNGKRWYQYTINGNKTSRFSKSFQSEVLRHHKLALERLMSSNGQFSQDFLCFVTFYYPNARNKDTRMIVTDFVLHPEKMKQLPKSVMKRNGTKERMQHRFVRMRDVTAFRNRFRERYGFYEISGIYIIFNKTRNKYYVGQGQKAVQRCLQHFTNPNDNAKDIMIDFENGDVFYINFVRLSDTKYNTLDELEYDYIAKYDCVNSGYNKKHGNRTNRKRKAL